VNILCQKNSSLNQQLLFSCYSFSGKPFKIGQQNFAEKFWEDLSWQGLDCLQKMLRENPEERPSAEELLDLPWFEVSLS